MFYYINILYIVKYLTIYIIYYYTTKYYITLLDYIIHYYKPLYINILPIIRCDTFEHMTLHAMPL
jgi:hypothetical protein